ncbi:MAG: hypothetical protein ACRBCS_10925 [Cellvibrionaceae bacterium]
MSRILITLSLILLLGCESKVSTQTTSYEPALSMMETMNLVLDPAADGIWGHSGWDITAEGEKELWPETEEGWNQLVHSAAVIVEAGNLLKIPGRVEGADGRGEDWIAYSQAITDTGKQLLKAGQERDKQAIFDLGGQLYRVCVACHTRYAYPDSE